MTAKVEHIHVMGSPEESVDALFLPRILCNIERYCQLSRLAAVTASY